MSIEAASIAWASSLIKQILMESACAHEVLKQPQGAWWCVVMVAICIAQKAMFIKWTTLSWNELASQLQNTSFCNCQGCSY